MKLKDILTDEQVFLDIDVTSLAFDSEKVRDGSLFFCLNGFKANGHDYIERARKNGAVCAVVERFIDDELPQVLVKNTRSALAVGARNFYGKADEKMKMIALSGTNGKTSTAYLIKSILEQAGKKVGMVGTNGIFIGKERYETALTTPDPIEYNYMLAKMLEMGVQFVVSEVSAHSLALNKTDGIRYDVAGFTNFSRDHLDFFSNMQNYKQAKLKLYSKSKCDCAVVNVDDEVGREIANVTKSEVITYGIENPSDVFAINEQSGENGLKFVMNINDEIVPIKCSLCGRFNVYNIMCAATICYKLGIGIYDISEGVRKINKVDGRFNIISTKNNSIIIDFAHTDDGLKNAICAIKEFAKGRIITVFGCGGDRDRSKRALMGEVVSSMSDYCILTSDNPRSEDPLSIIEDIKKGIKSDNFTVVVKRKEAIMYAISIAKKNDIIFIAGKGAEQYQEINGIKRAYNDEKFIMQMIEENAIK